MPAWYGARRMLTLADGAPIAIWQASSGSLPSFLSLTRASTGWYSDNTGSLQTASNDVARFDYTLGSTPTFKGMLLESARTNSIRNSTMQGAVAGSAGTLPTNWSVSGFAGLTRTLATGTEFGMPYIDVRYNGTTSGTSGNLNFEATTQIAAATGQTWTGWIYHRLTAGSLTNVTSIVLQINERNGAGSSLTGTGTTFTPTSTFTQTTVSRVFNQATTAFTNHFLIFNWSNGVAVDFTLRIYQPELEGTAITFAESPIATSTVAVTRAADVPAAANYANNPAIIQYRSIQTATRARKVINPWSGVSSETDEWIESAAVYPIGTSSTYLNTKLTVDGSY